MEINKIRGKEVDQFFDAILSLKTREECYEFFDDVATINEVQALSQRLQVAKLLHKGETYQSIEKATTASTTTISRVRRSLHYGSGGYKKIIKRLDQHNS